MLVEQTMFGLRNKVQIAIDRLKAFEPEEGYYLAFSGGKDSQCIYHLAKEAGVKFDAHYNLTTVDPPELVRFIFEKYKDVEVHRPKKSMWRLIEKKGLPNRQVRFCCQVLKEGGGEGRVVVTGVRWAESNSRKNNRGVTEIIGKTKAEKMLFNDNDEDRKLFENCQKKGKRVINPIVDWEDDDVWEYLNNRNIEHCCLYDQGMSRLGCIGCPLAGTEHMAKEFTKYPIYYENYKKAIGRWLPGYLERCKNRNAKPCFDNVDDWMEWWIYGTSKGYPIKGQIDIFDDIEYDEAL